MTIADLIKLLQTMPQDALVLAYAADEDYSVLEESNVVFNANTFYWNDATRDRREAPCVSIG